MLAWCTVLGKCKLFTTQSRILTTQRRIAFKNIAAKGENAGNQFGQVLSFVI